MSTSNGKIIRAILNIARVRIILCQQARAKKTTSTSHGRCDDIAQVTSVNHSFGLAYSRVLTCLQADHCSYIVLLGESGKLFSFLQIPS